MKKIIISLCLCVCWALSAQGAATDAGEKTFTNSLGMAFTLIPAGEFTMGMTPETGDTENTDSDATPAHTVNISQPFYLSIREVTQEQWEAVMQNNPSRHRGRDNPVEQVSWDDVQLFLDKLNEKETSGKYRLPTEAEWEYAARAGTNSVYSFGDKADDLDLYAWYGGNAAGATHPAGEKLPNPWGLYDMHGNVWEWVQDRYGANYYTEKPRTDPQGPAQGDYRVLRGGCWNNNAAACRSDFRRYYPPDGRLVCTGFRLAFSPNP